MRTGLLLGFFVYLIFGIYFLNSALPFLRIPELSPLIHGILTFVGGFLIILGAINYFRVSRRRKVLPGI